MTYVGGVGYVGGNGGSVAGWRRRTEGWRKNCFGIDWAKFGCLDGPGIALWNIYPIPSHPCACVCPGLKFSAPVRSERARNRVAPPLLARYPFLEQSRSSSQSKPAPGSPPILRIPISSYVELKASSDRDWQTRGFTQVQPLVWSMAEPRAKKNKVYQTWTPEMDTTLLAVLVEHHNNGDRAQNGWKPHVYNACIKNVKDACGVDITKDNITGRIKTFDKQYEIINKMLAQSGFGWDWEKNMVSVESDEVWSRYVEANKDARAYRNKVVHNWESIHTIYSKDHATSAGARIGTECVHEPQDTSVAEETPKVPQKRQRTGDAILCMMGKMQTSFDDALKTTEPLPMPKVTPPSEILDALKKVPYLGDSDMLKAYGNLIVSERLFEALMALPEGLRKPWLLTLD